MTSKKLFAMVLAFGLLLSASASIFADTIRLKDGTTLRGQIIGFRDQQFTVLLGSGARNRRSRIMLYMEDVESVEFDAATNASVSTDAGDTTYNNAPAGTSNQPAPSIVSGTSTTPTASTAGNLPPRDTAPPPATSSTTGSSQFIQINVRVRGDNTANGWTNSGFVVRRGQRLRISATGRINLGQNRFSTPSGLPTIPDRDKLMRNEPTGALVAVIGDDNDSFILVGQRREFVAQRDGVLFLGVNEGNLNDNAGNYDAVIEAETAPSGSTR